MQGVPAWVVREIRLRQEGRKPLGRRLALARLTQLAEQPLDALEAQRVQRQRLRKAVFPDGSSASSGLKRTLYLFKRGRRLLAVLFVGLDGEGAAQHSERAGALRKHRGGVIR